MEVLRTIALYVEDKDMPFIVIGGHAINAYGISRQTGDIDLLIQKSQKDKWVELLSRLNYKLGQNDDKFARFRHDQIGAWPIDLMLVDNDTFSKFLTDSSWNTIGVAKVRLVSARHLALLKIHALKHYQEHRYVKDYTDLISLLRTGLTGISDLDLRAFCERYAGLKLYDKIKADLSEGKD
ncbi:MAG: hypothetical protein KDD53_09550 [Bdellovibrionales bacterium]|nr:hypothetical protein [Bdellovibrionales bacterium]